MTDDLIPFNPDWTLRPGVALEEILSERHLDPARAAALTGLSPQEITGVLAGTTTVTAPIADGLARLGPPARYWLNYEQHYQADLARGAKDLSEERQQSH